MVKKVLALALGLVLTVSAMAQMGPSNPMVSQSDIQFWTGTGSNRAVVAITWNDSAAGNIGIAWGVQWNGNLLVRDIMDTIAVYDQRLNITWNSTHTYINNLSFADADMNLDLTAPVDPDMGFAWWWYNWKSSNGTDKQSGGVMGDTIDNGDFVDWIPMDYNTYESYAADTMIMAVDPNGSTPTPVESTIAFSDILYWVGTGANEAVMAVNWADTALAWGYKFDGNKTVADMMDDIAAADPRFSYTMEGGYLGDILFVKGEGDTLSKPAYSWWESKNNGISDAGMTQPLVNGDFEKWAVPEAGIIVDSMEYQGYWYYSYIYNMPIHPVSVPTSEGITVAEGMTLSVYPNPAVSSVKVSFDALESAGEVVLFDMTGRRVIAMPVAAGSTEAQIAVNSLANGVYLLRVGDATAKVVVR